MQNKNQKSKIKNQKLHGVLLGILEKKREDIKKIRIKKHESRSKGKKTIIHDSLFMIPSDEVAIIAEIKFASPTNPSLGSKKELLKRAKEYEEAGSDAISIITEPHFFKGDVAFVSQVKKIVKIPVLQKDFVIDEKQIYQAKETGSDALLLIARLVDKKTLQNFVKLCFVLNIEPVVEINNEEDLKKAIESKTNVIAVNARNLENFEINVDKACMLMKKIPDNFIKLGFSGINSSSEIKKYKKAGARGVLVGTSLMQAKDIKTFISKLIQKNVLVKICATRSLKAAEIGVKNGAEFLGLVFTPHIKTHTVDLEVAKEIGKKMKNKINLVGVFQNMPLDVVQKIIKDCNLDYAQFHGDESPEYLSKIKIKKIKAFRLAGDLDVSKARSQMKQFNVEFYLVDRIKQSEGPMLNLEKVSILAKEFPLVFAGGLNPENVVEVIKKVKPKIVDVASGVETNGKQDLEKIKQFIQNAKGALRLSLE